MVRRFGAGRTVATRALVGMLAAAVALVAMVGMWPVAAGADPVVGPVITAGTFLGSVAVDESLHRIYVSDEETSQLLAIDGSTNTVVGTLAIPPRDGGTHELAVDPRTHRVYVVEDAGLLAVDGPAMKTIGPIGDAADLYEPVVVPSTGRVYALHIVGVSNQRIELVVVSPTAVVTTVDVGAPLSSGDPHLTADTASNVLYVTGTSTGTTVVDGATNATTVMSEGGDGRSATDPVLHRLYVVDELGAALRVVDPSTAKLVTTVPLGPPATDPTSAYLGPVAVDDRLRIAYVTGGSVSGAGRNDVITVVDLVTNKVRSVLGVEGIVGVDTVSSRGYAARVDSSAVTVLLGDTAPPDTTITSAPTTVASGRSASFDFAGTDNVTSPASLAFTCSVDGGAFTGCTSPLVVTLPAGAHRVAVRALDQAGNLEPDPATAAFTVASPASPTATTVAPTSGPVAASGAGVSSGSPATPTTVAARGQAGLSPTSTSLPATSSTPTAASAAASSTDPVTEAAPASPAAPAVTPQVQLPGSTAPAELTVVTRSGAVAGPPGVGLTVAGSGFPAAACERVYVFLDGDRLGSATPGADGHFHTDRLTVPGRVRRGAYDVTASCSRSGHPAAATHLFTVRTRSIHRPQLVSSLHLPSQVPLGAKELGLSALAAAALVLLVGMPSELFDNTLTENYAEVRRWFRWGAPLLRPFARLSHRTLAVILLLVAALLFATLNPGFGFDGSSAATMIGLLVSLLVVAFVFSLPTLVHMRRRYGEPAALDILPFGLVIAALCVLASRLLHFQPGYLYGGVVGVAFGQKMAEEEDGPVTAASTAAMLVTAVLAWLVWAAVQRPASGSSPGPVLVVAETALAAVTVIGIESAVMNLLPMRFMAGSKVAAWSRAVWAGLFGLSLFAFIEILLRPGSGYVSRSSTASAVAVAVVFGSFALASVVFWSYFRFRRPRPDGGNVEGTGGGAARDPAERLV